MAKRSVASATLSFGLVAIPVKFYLSASPDNVSFNLITPKGNRVKMLTIDSVTGDDVSRSDCTRGYEYQKGLPPMIFTQQELEELGEGESGSLEIVEFVPAGSFNTIQVEKTYYLDAAKGGDKAYRMLVAALKQREVLAIAQWVNRGKQHLIMIGVQGDVLIAHQMYYDSEVRKFELDCATFNVSDKELAMAGQLIDMLTSESFDSSKYKNTFNEKLKATVEKRLAGGSAPTTNEEEVAKDVGDLFAALQASLSQQPTSDKKPAKKSSKKAG